MIALVVLFFLVLTILIFGFYLNKKKILSPSFIFNFLFLLASIAAILGNATFWKEGVSFITVTIIASSLLVFTFGEALSRVLLDRLFKKRRTEEGTTKKTNDDYGEQKKKRYATKKMLLVLAIAFVVSMAIVGIATYYYIQIAISLGYRPLAFNILRYLRDAALNDITPPSWVLRLTEVASVTSLVAAFFFSYVLFRSKKKAESLLFLPLLLPMIILAFLQSGRVGFVYLAVALLVSGIINYTTAKAHIRRRWLLVGSGLLVTAFVAIFLISGASRSGNSDSDSALHTICLYLGGHIVAFDKYLRNWDYQLTTPFAANTFYGVRYILGMFASNIEPGNLHDSFIHFANGQPINTYTIFKGFVGDWGFVPNYIFTLLLGLFYGSVFYFVQNKKKGFSLWYLYYPLILYYLVISIASAQATTTLFTWRRISYVLYLVVFGEFVRLLLYGKKDFVLLRKVFYSDSPKINLAVSIISQAVVLMASLFISLFFPKYLDRATDFSSWQYFILLTGFIGVFHFGFCDGVYLKLGGKASQELNGERLPQKAKIFLITQLFFSVLILVGGFLFWSLAKDTKGLIFVCLAVYLLVYNLFTFYGYVFQATDRIRFYSFAVIINKVIFVGGSAILFLLRTTNFLPYVILYICCTLLGLVTILALGRKTFFARGSHITKSDWRDTMRLTKDGFWVMIATLSGGFVLSISKYIADWRWGSGVFSDVAYSFTIMAIFMAFISQVCLVLFPILRRSDPKNLPYVKIKMDELVSMVMPLAIVFYYPVAFLIRSWLPQFSGSVYYLGIIVPVIIFEAKTQTLCTTYFKTLQKQKTLLLVNIISLSVSTALGFIASFALDSPLLLMLSACVGLIVQSVVGQILLSRIMGTKVSPFIAADILYFVLVGLVNYYLPWWGALLAVLGYLVFYYLVFHRTLIGLYITIKGRREARPTIKNGTTGEGLELSIPSPEEREGREL